MPTPHQKRAEQAHQRVWVEQVVATAQAKDDGNWHGTITFKIEAGLIKRVISEESKIPPPFNPATAPVRLPH